MSITTTISIDAAVGAGSRAKNFSADVMAVQTQINGHSDRSRIKLKVDGRIGPKTIAAIRYFQTHVCGMRWPDGRVDPRGKTETALNNANSSAKFSAAPEGVAESAVTAPVNGYLYFHGSDAPGVGTHSSSHAPDKCHHVIVSKQDISKTSDLLSAKIAQENLSIMDMVINTHGVGAGTLSIGGLVFNLGQNANAFFKPVRPHLKPTARITIFACAFALPYLAKSADDAWWVHGNDITEGKGTRALQACARYTGRNVRAGFGIQFGDMTGFTGVWANSSPSGKITFHTRNKTMSTGEYITYLSELALAAPGDSSANASRLAEQVGAWLGLK